jgi:glycogen debranching enzyme
VPIRPTHVFQLKVAEIRDSLRSLAMRAALLAFCAGAVITIARAEATNSEFPQTPGFSLNPHSGPSIVRRTAPWNPFTVSGPRGAILGQQDGVFEAWIFPWKILSDLRIRADMENYPVPIAVNEYASMIEVEPDHTTIVYSHANFTIRETLLAPQDASDGTGVLALFEVRAVRPLTLTFQFRPEMKRMWPALSDDRPSPEWVKTPAGGFYVLHLNFPDQAAAIGMPNSVPGMMAPYQERPKDYPLELVVHIDPTTRRSRIFPLLMTVAETKESAASSALEAKLMALNGSIQALYEANQKHYQDFINSSIAIETPDKSFDDAFTWAELAIDQLRVETTPGHRETALVAGFTGSGDSARPGFGWFFGRDALWTLYAVTSYGDFPLVKHQLEFLIHRQSPEGKIIHEWSQTADLLDWKSLPYAFASSDATPLLLMATADYFAVSHDKAFIKANWDALQKAWDFEQSHDSDGDGIYENTEGSGWVESWPQGMPHQEIYLAALDQQASTAFARLATATAHADLARVAEARARRIQEQIEREYFLKDQHYYAFSRNADGTTDDTLTIYPAVADWDGTFSLAHSSPMMALWASAEISTDWGTRDLSDRVSFYDPISYHQGSVWPLFTGWVSLSEYRNGRSLSGYAHLMQNANLTWFQNPGAVTELLSGEFFAPLGRSTSHQLWSSAMVISPTLRGLFGLRWDAARNTLSISPALPATWDGAKLHRVPFGDGRIEIELKRSGAVLEVRASGVSGLKLESRLTGASSVPGGLRIPLPSVEVGMAHGLPEPGSVTDQMKVLNQEGGAHSITLDLAAPANSVQKLTLRINAPNLKIHSNLALPLKPTGLQDVTVPFPAGTGYVEKSVTFSW